MISLHPVHACLIPVHAHPVPFPVHAAEFMGVLLFQIFGGAAPPKDTTAPAANGFALVAIIYAFANISGAHLNPAVTFALMCTGHMKWWKGLLYVIVQVRCTRALSPVDTCQQQADQPFSLACRSRRASTAAPVS
jgi:hypothetical protein